MELHTKSRDGLYEATAEFMDGNITVKTGSKINRRNSQGFSPSQYLKELREKEALFSGDILQKDIKFDSLSTAATFVTGRIANGMIVWKTKDGRYVRYTLKQGGEKDGK